jgi:hypothetical protein
LADLQKRIGSLDLQFPLNCDVRYNIDGLELSIPGLIPRNLRGEANNTPIWRVDEWSESGLDPTAAHCPKNKKFLNVF